MNVTCEMVATPKTDNFNCHSGKRYSTDSKNLCLSTFRVSFVLLVDFRPVYINHTASAVFFKPSIHSYVLRVENLGSVHSWQSIFHSSLPHSIHRAQKGAFLHVGCPWCRPLVEQSAILTRRKRTTVETHTQSGLELQLDQASVELSIVRRRYSILSLYF